MSKKGESKVVNRIWSFAGRSGLSIVILLWLICALSPASMAQVLYGSLTGNVTDPSNAAVPGAHVQAVNVETNVVRENAANESGVYLFTALQPGVYKITFSATNFGQKVVERVRLYPNKPGPVDMKLE